MKLNKQNIALIPDQAGLDIPDHAVFSLPEKVLQFGTGVLLRGLPDYYIDKANRRGIFNGRVVVVKSTTHGGADVFTEQDSMYTLCIRGIQGDTHIEETIINTSISRVLSAATDWDVILACARNPELGIIISNTTEVGIVASHDDIHQTGAPTSFPGKLLAFLWARYNVFGADADKGMIIIPTELVTNNGKVLQRIVLDLARENNLPDTFINWLKEHNPFCDSLVDRIVPGKLPAYEQAAVEEKLGYTDKLMIMAEPFSLWAIETTNPLVTQRLTFARADDRIVITPDIEKFRELKLRLLNGTHTFSCALAVLAGFDTVREAMTDETMSSWIRRLMMLEIAAAMKNELLTYNEACAFANSVLDRFRNPYLEHRWLSISLNFTSKMRLRNIPLLLRLHDRKSVVPEQMALGFAAYLLFMKCKPGADGLYVGSVDGNEYIVHDEYAAYFAHKWRNADTDQLVDEVLADKNIWDTDLSEMKPFSNLVKTNLVLLQQEGAMSVLNSKHLKKTVI